MYLGRHWPSDTVASAALATAWNGTLITFLRSR
jgi:membrane-associated phospholipid phosphatase